MSKAGLQCADRFFLAYRAHKGQADQVTQINIIFNQLPPERQEEIIVESPLWADHIEQLEAMLCPTCKAKIEAMSQ